MEPQTHNHNVCNRKIGVRKQTGAFVSNRNKKNTHTHTMGTHKMIQLSKKMTRLESK